MSTFSSSFHHFLPVTNNGYYHLLWWTFNGVSLFIFNSRWWQSQLLTRKMAHVRAKLAIASRKIFTRLLYFNDHHSINDWLVHWWSMPMFHERNVWWFKVELDDEKILRATKLRYAGWSINWRKSAIPRNRFVIYSIISALFFLFHIEQATAAFAMENLNSTLSKKQNT